MQMLERSVIGRERRLIERDQRYQEPLREMNESSDHQAHLMVRYFAMEEESE